MDANLITGLLVLAAPFVVGLLWWCDVRRTKRAAPPRKHAPHSPSQPIDHAKLIEAEAAGKVDQR